jgi:glycerol-3-phosphate acyltransferase PlsY
MTDTMAMLAAAGLGYLLGAIPSGLLLTRLAGLGDIRDIGSGNIGATNVLRTGNKAIAALTLALDIAKGTLAVVLGGLISQGGTLGWDAGQVAGLGAFLGHLFPVWLGFKGGKGVATYIGVLLGLYWPAALVFCGCWLIAAAAFRYSSLSALIAAVVAPITAFVWSGQSLALLLAILSMLLISRHHANIRRLLDGKEPKIGEKT